MYMLNFEYLKQEADKINNNDGSELINAILDYKDPLPIELDTVFHRDTDFYDLDFPYGLRCKIQDLHGVNWVDHLRLELFNRPGESFEDCNNRLIKLFLDKTDLPVFIEK